MAAPRRYELTDFEWSIIAPLLPNKPRGVPRVDDRKVLNGIFWRLRTGHNLLQSFRAVAKAGGVGQALRGRRQGL